MSWGEGWRWWRGMIITRRGKWYSSPFIMKVFVILKLLSCKTYVFKEYILYVQNLNSQPVASTSKERKYCQSCLPAWCWEFIEEQEPASRLTPHQHIPLCIASFLKKKKKRFICLGCAGSSLLWVGFLAAASGASPVSIWALGVQLQ